MQRRRRKKRKRRKKKNPDFVLQLLVTDDCLCQRKARMDTAFYRATITVASRKHLPFNFSFCSGGGGIGPKMAHLTASVFYCLGHTGVQVHVFTGSTLYWKLLAERTHGTEGRVRKQRKQCSSLATAQAPRVLLYCCHHLKKGKSRPNSYVTDFC